jgi:glycosyltransferase involved in cell wall biosynthesis
VQGEMRMQGEAPCCFDVVTAPRQRSLYIVHVGALTGGEGDGLNQAVRSLARASANGEDRIELHALQYGTVSDNEAVVTTSHRRWRFPHSFGVSLSLWRAIQHRASSADIIHAHSLWTMPAICPGFVYSGTAAKLVISPHGTLAPRALQRSKWKKRLVWFAGQRTALRRADCFHATAENEAEDIRRLGFRQPIAVIPLGIDVPEDRSHPQRKDPRPILLYLGRLHPIKGIDLLIRAWARVQPAHPSWRLVIAGDDVTAPGYGAEMKTLVRELDASDITFVGAVYGAEKSQLYSQSDVFILPSHTENFGIVIAEALAHGLPVIASTGTPWAALEREECGWWINNDLNSLASCLDRVLCRDRHYLAAAGQRGLRWMLRDFGWTAVAQEFRKLYLWLSGQGEEPKCVFRDGTLSTCIWS